MLFARKSPTSNVPAAVPRSPAHSLELLTQYSSKLMIPSTALLDCMAKNRGRYRRLLRQLWRRQHRIGSTQVNRGFVQCSGLSSAESKGQPSCSSSWKELPDSSNNSTNGSAEDGSTGRGRRETFAVHYSSPCLILVGKMKELMKAVANADHSCALSTSSSLGFEAQNECRSLASRRAGRESLSCTPGCESDRSRRKSWS